ncbi:fidgetin-like protein 1 [Nematocida sp. LUAm3]|nr:fidgetin-like protein 1 [Nematocida sp. LUAm3]KAI5175892.1 fidgetin-like protein 1 [Nematocida sp. LUAm2]KAI5178726.1 fidgetin-like protein 1 [Nematocida sp. LUAm1]
MQKNFYELQRILEEMKNIGYVSPYTRRTSSPEVDPLYLKDYLLFLQERRRIPEVLPYVHDYPLQKTLQIEDVEKMLKSAQFSQHAKQYATQHAHATVHAPAISAQHATAHNTAHGTVNGTLDTFTSARRLMPADELAKLPKTELKTDTKLPKTESKEKDQINNESNVEQRLLDMINNEVLHPKEKMEWDEIVGLSQVKSAIKEIIIWPMKRPDLFSGIRRPPKALLLFGPPGTGKTLIGKCIASQINGTFFSISASSLTSKWVGEGEKLVRALFHVASINSPSVIFIDEIDSLLMQRSEGEQESTRRLKTELLIQMDGAKENNSHILVIGATNRPQEIDEAARRRFVKRLYIPLPDKEAIKKLVKKITENEASLSDTDLSTLSDKVIGYSGSDIFNLCREAAMEPIRELKEISSAESLRALLLKDFLKATRPIRKSVSEKDLKAYEDWDNEYGSK